MGFWSNLAVNATPSGVPAHSSEWESLFGQTGAGARFHSAPRAGWRPRPRSKNSGTRVRSMPAACGSAKVSMASELARVSDDRHVCLVSGTRGGKGVGVIVPNLCFWPGSCIVVDPKGENATVTARRRGGGSEYTTFARAKGLHPRSVRRSAAARPRSRPVTTRSTRSIRRATSPIDDAGADRGRARRRRKPKRIPIGSWRRAT